MNNSYFALILFYSISITIISINIIQLEESENVGNSLLVFFGSRMDVALWNANDGIVHRFTFPGIYCIVKRKWLWSVNGGTRFMDALSLESLMEMASSEENRSFSHNNMELETIFIVVHNNS